MTWHLVSTGGTEGPDCLLKVGLGTSVCGRVVGWNLDGWSLIEVVDEVGHSGWM